MVACIRVHGLFFEYLSIKVEQLLVASSDSLPFCLLSATAFHVINRVPYCAGNMRCAIAHISSFGDYNVKV